MIDWMDENKKVSIYRLTLDGGDPDAVSAEDGGFATAGDVTDFAVTFGLVYMYTPIPASMIAAIHMEVFPA
jgi:hypothetical protein